MTSRARVFDLFAQREAARLADLGRATQKAAAAQAQAETAAARLGLMAREMHQSAGPCLAADLRANGLLTTRLVEEAGQLIEVAGQAAAERLRLRQQIWHHEQRRVFGETAASHARAAEKDEEERRAEAARPAPRRD